MRATPSRSAGKSAEGAGPAHGRTAGLEFGTALPRGTVLRDGDCFVLDDAGDRRHRRRAPEAGVRDRAGHVRPSGRCSRYHIGNSHQPLMLTDEAIVCAGPAGHGAGARLPRASRSPARIRPFTPVADGAAHTASAVTDDRLLPLLHLCDSLFPTGAFAHSDGLEAATDRGLGALGVRSWRVDGRVAVAGSCARRRTRRVVRLACASSSAIGERLSVVERRDATPCGRRLRRGRRRRAMGTRLLTHLAAAVRAGRVRRDVPRPSMSSAR